MSIRGTVTRGLGALLGSKIAEETGNSGALGGVAGYGLAMLARRSPLGLATAGAIFLGKKYLDSRRAERHQPTLALAPSAPDPVTTDVAAATDARDPALAASA